MIYGLCKTRHFAIILLPHLFFKVFEYQKWSDGGYVIIFRIASNWNLHVTLFLGKNVHHIILQFFFSVYSSQPKAFTARVFRQKKLLSSRLKKVADKQISSPATDFRASLRKLPTFFSREEEEEGREGRTKVCESRYSAHWRKITFRMKSPEDSLSYRTLQSK